MATKTTRAITLREAPHLKGLYEKEMHYDILLNGVIVGELYFNTRGYRGTIPTADGSSFSPGESSLATYKREIAAENRRFAERAALVKCP